MSSTRAKGYLNDWTPKPETRELIGNVQGVIRAGRFGAMSVRFIFYRLVANHGYPKTERAYKNLAEIIVKARRAGMIPFRAISDTGTETGGGGGYQSRTEFLRSLSSYGDYFGLNNQLEQPYFLEVWAEDAGSVPMLAGISRPWDLPVYGTGGFSSVTVTHEVADRVTSRWRREKRPTVILHVGDYDPSGVSIFESMCQDMGAFISAKTGAGLYESTGRVEDDAGSPIFIPHRVALTEEQTIELDLETAPPKSSDSRSNNWVGETVQVQAMTEDQMEAVVVEAIEQYIDQDKLDEINDRSERDRELIGDKIKDAIQDIIDEIGDE